MYRVRIWQITLQKPQIKGVNNKKRLRTATDPDKIVSVDQLVIPTPGFIPNNRGIPTTQSYFSATVSIDHFYDFTYIHLMEKLDEKSTVEEKYIFERV